MAKQNLILMSLEDEKIKKISNVISNDSCRKILDHLAEREATESELAKNLNIPISTVHYNLQQLMEAGLISSEEYHYSEKGREVNHYKLANKYIIIAPKKTKTAGLKNKLRNILPVALLTAGAAGTIHFTNRFFIGQSSGLAKAGTAAIEPTKFAADEAIRESTQAAATEHLAETAAPMAEQAAEQLTEHAADAAMPVAEHAAEHITDTAASAVSPFIPQNIALWFLFGALFVIVLSFIFSLFKRE